MNLHVERYGQGKKIIFIHGSGWNTRMWYGQRDYLKSSMEILLIDLPGHGKSPGNGCDTVEEYGEAVHGVIKGLGDDGCYIAGHSLGGAIAMSLALTYPDAVQGAILIGTGAKLRVLPQILEGITRDKEATVKSIAALAFSKKAPTALAGIDFDETMKCDAAVIYKDFNACDHFNVMDSVGSIKCPTLIICGTEDSLTPPKYSQHLNSKMQNSQLVLIEDAGHMVMMEKPEEVGRAIEAFVKPQ